MSNRDAQERFVNAAKTFHGLEPALQAGGPNVDPLTIEEVVSDLDAAIPGLTGEDLGRALVFKGYALLWRRIVEIRSDVRRAELAMLRGEKADSRLAAALEGAIRGRELLQAHGTEKDRRWADDVVNKLKGYQ
jgi:hypothetical protein